MLHIHRRRGSLTVASTMLLITPLAIWFVSSLHIPSPSKTPALLPKAAAGPQDIEPVPAATVEELLKHNPMAVVRMGRERYDREIRDWRAILLKQELLPDGLTPVQEIEVRYRNSPQTVYMTWMANAGGARRALWMPGDPRFVDQQGRALARVEPNGTLVRLVTTDVFVLVHGPDARKASRRTIDECGFASTFALLEKYNGIAEARGVLDFRYAGPGEIDGRKTYKIVRRLPYEGPDGPYPDALMVLHIDQEWLLPVAVYSYGDKDGTQLLGSYVFTKIELNPGLDEAAFAF